MRRHVRSRKGILREFQKRKGKGLDLVEQRQSVLPQLGRAAGAVMRLDPFAFSVEPIGLCNSRPRCRTIAQAHHFVSSASRALSTSFLSRQQRFEPPRVSISDQCCAGGPREKGRRRVCVLSTNADSTWMRGNKITMGRKGAAQDGTKREG